MEKNKVIITRHVGAIEWLRRRGIIAPILDHAAPYDVRGKIVIGNVPLFLAAEADEVWAIEMPNLWRLQRSGELTPDDMDKAGARIRRYKVYALED